MGFVGIDIGASNTRFVTSGKAFGVLPNNVIFLDDSRKVDLTPYTDEITEALEVTIAKGGVSQYFPMRALMGKLAERYAGSNDRPSGMMNKHAQRINYLSIITAIAVARLQGGVDEHINIYLALPPNEVSIAKDEVSNQLVGEYAVNLPKYAGGRTVNFTVESVTCLEESYMASVSYFFDNHGAVRSEHKKYLSGNVLSLDIGASTTDLAIIKNGQFLEKSGQTYKIGGNVARDYVISQVQRMYGFDLPAEEADHVVAEGRLQMGDGYVNVSQIVEDSKREIARAIVNQMQAYFRTVDIPIQNIRAIIVSGGGSMPSQYVENGEIIVTTRPLCHYITESLRQVSPGTVVEHFGENPRLANINGLLVKAIFDAAREAETKKAKQPEPNYFGGPFVQAQYPAEAQAAVGKSRALEI